MCPSSLDACELKCSASCQSTGQKPHSSGMVSISSTYSCLLSKQGQTLAPPRRVRTSELWSWVTGNYVHELIELYQLTMSHMEFRSCYYTRFERSNLSSGSQHERMYLTCFAFRVPGGAMRTQALEYTALSLTMITYRSCREACMMTRFVFKSVHLPMPTPSLVTHFV